MESDAFIGRTIGPYQVLEKIGQGGMAEVFKGFHPALRRYVAIKLLGRSIRADPVLTERFQREAQAIATLRHPNIIQVFDFGSLEDGHYLVMEYVEGTDLRVEMDRRQLEGNPFTPEGILHLLGQVADALDYAHRQGIIHRDIKPANILLTRDGQAILTDFGLAMLRNRISQATLGHSFGTPEYIAPEQAIDSRAAVPQSDLYAMGAILYEMVTGRPPFQDESPLSLALKHINEEPTPPSHYVPDLPAAVEAIILQAMAKEPGERFPTGQAMIEALRRAWLGGPTRSSQEERTHPARPTGDRPPPPPPPPPPAPAPQPAHLLPQASTEQLTPSPSRRRWPLVVGLLALLLIGSLGLLALLRDEGPFAVARATETPTPTVVLTPTAMPSPTATATATATPTRTPTRTPTSTPSPSPTTGATVAPTTSPTPTPTATGAPTPTETPVPTPTPTPAPGQVVTRPPDGMAMRFVPGGSFPMGTDDDPDAFPHEGPQHEVVLSPFWMDETEVTNAQYRYCVEAGACDPPRVSTAYDDPERADHPVVYVTWAYAVTYCSWLADETGLEVHLPTEAQWEMAASWDPSSGTKYRYPWGDETPDPAWLNFNGSGLNRTTPAGSYPQGASPYGILDLAGNVWEWVADWYGQDYYSTPDLPLDPPGPAYGSQCVMRGGSYGYGTRQARTTHRDAAGRDASGIGLGFRCVVSEEWVPPGWWEPGE